MKRPALLCIAPPYPLTAPPACAGALFGHLKAAGCDDFDFLDLRLLAPWGYTPSYRDSGPFGESFAADVPNLPLVLRLLRNFDDGEPLVIARDRLFDRFCLERGMNPQALHAYLVQLDRLFAAVAAEVAGVEFVGFTVWDLNCLSTFMAAAHLKRLPKPPYIVFGGPQTTQSANAARLALRSGVTDVVALSEGEETLLELWQQFDRGRGTIAPDLAGTLQRDGDGFRSTERKLMRMAALPLPDYDKVHLPAYTAFSSRRVLSYQLSRGCTDECSFCSEWGFWRQFRVAGVGDCLDQLSELKRRYGMQGVWFTDSLLNGNMKRLREFAEGLLSRSMELVWFGLMRAQMDRETAELLHRAGLSRVMIGVESLADDTLSLMNKRMTEAQNLQALRVLLDAGISVQAGIIPGFPGDTRAKFLNTLVRLRELSNEYGGHLHITVDGAYVAAPGQPMYEHLAMHGLTARGFAEDYLDIAPRYRDISTGVHCTVEGDNQGYERMGQFTLLRGLNDVSAEVPRHPLDHLEVDSESTVEPGFDHLLRDWFLLRIKTPSSLRYGLLVSGAEKNTVLRMRASESFFGGDLLAPMLEKEPYSGYLAALEEKHLIRPSRGTPRADAFRPEERHPFIRCPFAIARVADAGDGAELLIVHLVRRDLTRLPASLAPWFAALPGRWSDPPARSTPAPSAEQRELLLERGILLASPAAAVEKSVEPSARLAVAAE